MSKYDKLKRLAEAQPNKSWSRDSQGRMSHSAKQRMYGVYGPQCVSDYEDWGFTREAASFIAAASPAAILELIAESERLTEQCNLNDMVHGTKGRERLGMLLKAESDRAGHWKQIAEASRLLLEECNKVIAEDGGVYIELRAFLEGKMPASEVIALLKGAAHV